MENLIYPASFKKVVEKIASGMIRKSYYKDLSKSLEATISKPVDVIVIESVASLRKADNGYMNFLLSPIFTAMKKENISFVRLFLPTPSNHIKRFIKRKRILGPAYQISNSPDR